MPSNEGKIAVLLIHGIGDQKPMATLKRFVEAVISDPASNSTFEGDHKCNLKERQASEDGDRKDDKILKSEPIYWSKPDDISGLFELRRLQVKKPGPPRGRPMLEFYEYYWAHKMEGNALSHSLQWINNLLFRWPSTVPVALRRLWGLCWVGLLSGVGGIAYFSFHEPQGLFASAIALAIIVAKLVADLALRDWIGDAARYFNARPANIMVRESIRRDGVELLKKLYESGDYKRVIVVGHSLGSAIALDILYHYWTSVYEEHSRGGTPQSEAIENFERAVQCAEKSTDPTLKKTAGEWRELQKSVWLESRENGLPWLITDLITLGSPLTHLPFLLGLSDDQFEERLLQRELPKCPPVLDDGDIAFKRNYSYGKSKTRSIMILHHAACFAVTRWTNIYFPHNGWFKGDPVGGPLRSLFGEAIDDREVRTSHWKGRLNHLDYWRHDQRDANSALAPLAVLKSALNLEKELPQKI